jgi:hypothetical protein
MRDAATVWRSGVSLIGAGPGPTRFVLSNRGDRRVATPLAFFTTREHGAGVDNHLADITFADFEIDGADVEVSPYDVLAKGLGLQYVVRGHFRNLYIHDTAATGFGCDFLRDGVVESLVVADCGRLDTGEDIGGAGIGIGIGGWGLSERTTITGCTAVGNGVNGIFIELQKDHWPPPRGIRITGCHVEANRFGISDWGADGLVVSGCTIVGNLEAGFDVSGQGTSSIGGRGGIVTGCVIDANARDGVSLGNTPGPYTLHGNRITNNGRYGYRQHNLHRGTEDPAAEIVLDGNDVWGNGLDGVRIDAAVRDLTLVGNRIRNNGRRAAPAAEGGGPTVAYAELSLADEAADWPLEGHRGKTVTVGHASAVVLANTATELVLAPWRPGARTAWEHGVPRASEPYRLPEAPPTRAGVTLDAAAQDPTVRANHVWDNQEAGTQTHGLWITGRGACTAGRVEDNDLVGNADDAARFDAEPRGGHWDRNLGVPARLH